MNVFREIQPTQAITPLRKARDAVNKQQEETKKKNKESEQETQEKSEHKIDEFI